MQTVFLCFLIFILQLLTIAAFAQTADLYSTADPLWEYGAGLGVFQYEQYPASNQIAYMAIPFPTFQYRGEHLRANDRDGARAFLLRQSNYSFEISGNVQPGMGADNNNQARVGMPPIPWLISLGPQFVYRFSKFQQFKFGVFPTLASDFKTSQASGVYFDARFVQMWEASLADSWLGNLQSRSFATFSLQAASLEYLATYFEVDALNARTFRPSYQASAGFLSYELSFIQTLSKGRFSFYLGGFYCNYDLSVNKQSPLHQSDQNLIVSFGVNYLLGESKVSAVPEGEIKGLLNEHSP